MQQLLELLGVPLGIRANLSKKLNCRPDVLLGPGKRLRLLDSNLKEEEFRAAKILPRHIETMVNVQQLLTGSKSFFRLVLMCKSLGCLKKLTSFFDENPDGRVVADAIRRASDAKFGGQSIFTRIKLLFQVQRFVGDMPEEVREIVTNGDLFARLDVFLSKEDCDAGSFVVDGGGVRLAGVIHAGDAKSNNWLAYIFSKVFSN